MSASPKTGPDHAIAVDEVVVTHEDWIALTTARA